MKRFKESLARVFDDNLSTLQWKNWVDYFLITLILLSTAQVFISTFNLPPHWETIMHWIDITTLIIFTVEVSLRIWVADLLNPKYKGFLGRLKYCFSFYGMIDFLSTYPFYLTLWFPIPYNVLKVLRIARLFRIFRYMKSFRLLHNAISSKKKELYISLQFLIIVTLILSFILFFFEHAAQPEVYDNGFASAIWAFAQYIGDPGGFAETPPVTLVGRIIACIIGVLGIAIFAVPAGLIGSGFSDAIDEDRKQQEIRENIDKLKRVFERKLDRPTGYQIVPQHLSIVDIQARMGMKVDDIFDAVKMSGVFRVINLATTQPIEDYPQDKLAVEHFLVNRPYGCCIDRNSKITIVSPSSMADASVGNFSYYLALMGGFNYISREVGEIRPYHSYYSFADRNSHEENLPLYMSDLEQLTTRKDSWTLTLLVASGANEPKYPTIFHFSAGGKKGDESFEGENLVVDDTAAYKAFYEDLSAQLQSMFEMGSDHQRYHNVSSPNVFVRKYENGKGSRNNIILRIAWSALLWDSRRMSIAKVIADALNRHFENDVIKEVSPELMVKTSGY